MTSDTAARPAAPERAPQNARTGMGVLVRRRSGMLVLATAALALAAVVSVCVGGRPTTLADVLQAFIAPTESEIDVTILGLRVPRTILGIIVGGCLAAAGTLTQGHTRNPIADPGLLGIYQGAALAVVIVIALGADPSGLELALVAFVGALVAVTLVFALASTTRGRSGTVTVILGGVAVAALSSSLVTAISLLDHRSLEQLRFWQVGSLAMRNDALPVVWPAILVGFVLAIANTRALNTLALGDDQAAALGQPPWRSRAVGILAIALLGSAAVMLAGPIAFAGLVVPHLARSLMGPDYRWQLAASVVLGGAIVLFADTIGRVVARPGELSVTVVLAIVGAPLFVAIARSRRRITL